MSLLLEIVRRVEDQSEKPTPHDLVCTQGDPAVVLGVDKRTTENQPQATVDQLSLEMREHVIRGIHLVVFIVEFLY
jgi:hypothetical protein